MFECIESNIMKNFDFEQFNFEPSESSRDSIKLYYRHYFARKVALNARHGLLKSDIDLLRSTGKYSEEILNLLPVRNTQAANRPKHKLHKEFTPKNIAVTIKFSIGRRLIAPVAKHDINSNPYIRKTRKAKKQRLNVRDEREEIFNAAVIAFVKHCEMSIYEECLFEVKAPLKQIAMELGLISKNGRYDRLNRLTDMMQEAGMIVVMHEFDKERYKQKAVRIFLLPDFFYSLGHTPESLRKMVAATNWHLIKKGGKKSLAERAKAHEERLKDLNVADMRANPKNAEKYALLKRAKEDFLNDKVFRNLQNKSVKIERKAQLERDKTKEDFLPDMPLTLDELFQFMPDSPLNIDLPDVTNAHRRRH